MGMVAIVWMDLGMGTLKVVRGMRGMLSCAQAQARRGAFQHHQQFGVGREGAVTLGGLRLDQGHQRT